MHRDIDGPAFTPVTTPNRLTWLWVWAIGGGGAMMALALTNAAVWAFALWWLMWVVAGVAWFQRDVMSARQMTHPSLPDRASSSLDSAGWAEWVSGWYWELNSTHELTVLKPGVGVGQDGATDWTGLSALLDGRPLWWSCWEDVGAEAEPVLERMKFYLCQGVAITGQLVLPWPKRLLMLESKAGLPAKQCVLWGSPRHDASGKVVGYCGVLRLLVEASEAAQPMPEGEQTVAYMTANEQEALQYALSHDLRAPLRVIDGFSRILKEDYGHLLDRLGRDHLDRVLSASARMNGMIDAILGQAQLANSDVERIDIDLSALAFDIGNELTLLGVNKDVRVSLQVCEGMRVSADALLVRRVLENLIGNALKYSAKVHQPKVEVGVMPATNPAVFFVRDNGAGFDMQHADKLFGLFQRMHSAKEFPGTGVGLAGVQNIVRRHGGRVWAEASPGQGACFYFTLMGSSQAQSEVLQQRP